MKKVPDEISEKEFEPNKTYKFDPPVLTHCRPVAVDEWTQKSFSEGWCLKFAPLPGAFVFQGKPVGEDTECYFLIEWGKGSKAVGVNPPTLRLVE